MFLLFMILPALALVFMMIYFLMGKPLQAPQNKVSRRILQWFIIVSLFIFSVLGSLALSFGACFKSECSTAVNYAWLYVPILVLILSIALVGRGLEFTAKKNLTVTAPKSSFIRIVIVVLLLSLLFLPGAIAELSSR